MIRKQADDDEILAAMKNAILHKPTEHQFFHAALEGSEEVRKMSQIGG